MQAPNRTSNVAISEFIEALDIDSVANAVRESKNKPLPKVAQTNGDDDDQDAIKETRYGDLYDEGVFDDDDEEEDGQGHREEDHGESMTERA
ncbi:hypothetical protein MMC18_007228 [Xylographa bjoerkii]|nr:hypothetical protein [Xylographa bjoerkii]